jgi:hypothetical protein
MKKPSPLAARALALLGWTGTAVASVASAAASERLATPAHAPRPAMSFGSPRPGTAPVSPSIQDITRALVGDGEALARADGEDSAPSRRPSAQRSASRPPSRQADGSPRTS